LKKHDIYYTTQRTKLIILYIISCLVLFVMKIDLFTKHLKFFQYTFIALNKQHKLS